jgi:hypothetical protein
MASILTLVMLAVTFCGFAKASCSTVELRGALGNTRNQSDKGWCFANSDSDLLTFAYHQILNGKQVSSSFTAIHYFYDEITHNKTNNIFGEGGSLYRTLNIINSVGKLCPQSIDDAMMSRGFKVGLSEKLKTFQQLYRLYHLRSDPQDLQQLLDLVHSMEVANSFLKDYSRDLIIHESLDQPNFEEAVIHLVGLLCSQQRVSIVQPVEFMDYFDYEGKTWDSVSKGYMSKKMDYQKKIDLVLDQHPRPIAITYNVDATLTENRNRQEIHASVIAGRRTNSKSGKCEYLIRNSWGPDCLHYDYTNQQFHKDANGNYIMIPIYRYECEEGAFWVPDEDINKLVTEITYQKIN